VKHAIASVDLPTTLPYQAEVADGSWLCGGWRLTTDLRGRGGWPRNAPKRLWIKHATTRHATEIVQSAYDN